MSLKATILMKTIFIWSQVSVLRATGQRTEDRDSTVTEGCLPLGPNPKSFHYLSSIFLKMDVFENVVLFLKQCEEKPTVRSVEENNNHLFAARPSSAAAG